MAAGEDSENNDDEVLAALDALCRALEQNTERNDRAIERAAAIHRMRADGMSYREIVAAEKAPLIVELTRQNLNNLVEAGSRLRRAEAAALHAEGMTMDEIAALFGVTRQRISALLKQRRLASGSGR
jgi:DNA-binding CsgD family transcriptional regulator